MKVLTIVGNGFDLGHGLRTEFDHFIESNYDLFNKKYDVFRNGNNSWNEVENRYRELLCEIIDAREEFDITEEVANIIQGYGFTEYGEVNYYCYTSDAFDEENTKITFYIELLKNFENDFLAYLRDIKLDVCGQYDQIKKLLLSSYKVINFNYTKTIENIYGIKDVIHIHGSIDDKIAIGCGSLEDAKTTAIDNRYPTIEKFSLDKYGLQEMMSYYEENMDGNLVENHFIKTFFDEVSSTVAENEEKTYTLIDEKSKSTLASRKQAIDDLKREHYDIIYIIGHSIGYADREIFEALNKDAKFIYYYHGDADSKQNNDIKRRIDALGWKCEWISNSQLYRTL